MTEIEQPSQNGIDLSAAEDDDSSKARPADIEQDMREMERRKRVEAIMSSKLFREELERIVDSARDGGGATGILQQLSDIVGVPSARIGSVYKASNCLLPINDIRGVESMGYAKGEKILRCKLAATFRLLDLYGWTQGLGAQITARLKVDQEYFLVNPYGLLYHEITASSLNKVDMQGHIVEQGTTNFGVNKSHFVLHSVVHAARPDIRCAIYIGCSPVVAISSLKTGLLPLTKDACVLGEITTHPYTGSLLDEDERNKLVRNLGPNSKVMLLANHGALCCGETIEEAFYAACHIVQACETQLKLLPVGLDNLVLIPEESRKVIYDQSRRPPEDLEKKFAAAVSVDEDSEAKEGNTPKVGAAPKWRVGGAEFEALMRMLDNAGYRTGYIYRHPLIKSDPPKPKNDVELPPAVSSLGYLLEEEELFRQGIWKKGDLRKGGDRSRWLNSPNVYQKVEVLETGTPDPKKITKWVAEGSPTHSTPVRIEDPLQFVPAGTNPKEFKRLQQQIKDNRRADKISAGPQSHILEGVTWDEANRIKDATVSSAGDHVVLMGAASKGIIQRGYQHNATVYKAPYAKNPFDNVTDDELNEYKRTVERKKKSIHGEYTDTDFSESEALSSLPTSGAQQIKTAGVTQSEPEDMAEHQVMRIETKQAPVPSQPEVVLSDATLSFINGERSHMAVNQRPPTGRDVQDFQNVQNTQDIQDNQQQKHQQSIVRISQEHLQQAKGVFMNNVTTTSATTKTTTMTTTATSNLKCARSNKENIYIGNRTVRKLDLVNDLRNALIIRGHTPRDVSSERGESNSSSSTYPWGIGVGGAHSIRSGTNLGVLKHLNENLDIVSPGAQLREKQLNGNILMLKNDSEVVKISTCNSGCNLYCETYAGGMVGSPTIDSQEYADNRYDSDDSEYRKSAFCCTPGICEVIFECIRNKSNYENDLIMNIPFTHLNSSSQSGYSTTPRRVKSDQPLKNSPSATSSNSPYRTVSHFGFKSPMSEPQPEHKHLPIATDPRKYVPLRKSISYEEIFSSPRYAALCDNCFKKVVRLKPELMHMRAHLRNLADVPMKETCDSGMESDQYEYVECASSDIMETIGAYTSPLETLVEVEEERSDKLNTCEKMSQTSFMEKIARMNYSEESSNHSYVLCNLSSNLSLDLKLSSKSKGINESENKSKSLPTRVNRCKIVRSLYVNDKHQDMEDGIGNPNEQQTSITEIWDFGNWEKPITEPETCSFDEKIDSMETENTLLDTKDIDDTICEDIGQNSNLNQQHQQTSTFKITELAINNEETLVTENEPSNVIVEFPETASTLTSSQSSITREQRLGRTKEFHVLWEDHIGKNPNDDAASENGLAIEELSVDQLELEYKSYSSGTIKDNNSRSVGGEVDDRIADGYEAFYQYCDELHFDMNNIRQCDSTHSSRTYIVSPNMFFRESESNQAYTDSLLSGINTEISKLDKILNDMKTNDGSANHEELIIESGTELDIDDDINKIGDDAGNASQISITNNDLPAIFESEASEDIACGIESKEAISEPTTVMISVENTMTNLTELNEKEREILKEIDEKKLKIYDPIYEKIDDAIRNKLTPSKLDRLIKEYQLKEESNSMSSSAIEPIESDYALPIIEQSRADGAIPRQTVRSEKKILSLSERKKSKENQDKHSTRRSRSMEYDLNVTPPPLKRLNKCSTPPYPIQAFDAHFARTHKPIKGSTSAVEFRRDTMRTSSKKRNFILENIRNASLPRSSPKRICNTNSGAIFGKNPFGQNSINTTPSRVQHMAIDSEQVESSAGVYSFQATSTSPSLWVSIPPLTEKKLKDRNRKVKVRKNRIPGAIDSISNSSISSGTSQLSFDLIQQFSLSPNNSLSEVPCHTKVDEGLKELGAQINELHPRLDAQKNKIDDLGEQMAKCVRCIDDCVAIQNEIVDEQGDGREHIVLDQFAGDSNRGISTTFKLSETDD